MRINITQIPFLPSFFIKVGQSENEFYIFIIIGLHLGHGCTTSWNDSIHALTICPHYTLHAKFVGTFN